MIILENMKPEDWDGNVTEYKGYKCWQTTYDLVNYEIVITRLQPSIIVEIGPGEGGVIGLLKKALPEAEVISIGENDDYSKIHSIHDAFIIIDSDVYNEKAMRREIFYCKERARWLVICHTVRHDWGSYKALVNNWPERFERFNPPYPSRHTWLRKV